jgi:hypothetical protein
MKIFLNFITVLGAFASMFFIAFLFILLVAWPIMLLWNWAIVNAISVAKPIDYWTTVGLLIFIMLFKGPNTTVKSKD